MKSPRPIVIAGMHRSGTSFLTSCLAGLGVSVGTDLLPADQGNPRGYFEDRDFLALNRRILAAATCDEPGHRDWGWTISGFFAEHVVDRFLSEARGLVEDRMAQGRAWAFKDPRTSLLLDFWQRVFEPWGGGRYVLPYRFPWEVLQSIGRVGPVGGLHRPDWMLTIWCRYNRALLDFHRRHRDAALLVSTAAATADPGAFARLVTQRFDLQPTHEADSAFEPDLFRQGHPLDPVLADLVPAAWPEVGQLLTDLEDAADWSSGGEWRVPASVAPRLQPVATPDVSVVIPCRDHGQYLIEAVASVAAVEQRGRVAVELTIVDDGSTEPETCRILALLSARGFLVLPQPASGLASARNVGLENSRARYLLPIDADNRIRADFVEQAVALLDSKPEVAIAYGDVQEFGERFGRVEVPEFALARLLQSNFLDACAVYRREVWQETGGYDPVVPTWSDWDFWLSAAKLGFAFERLPEIAQDYRVRDDSMLQRALAAGQWRAVAGQIVAKHRLFFGAHVEEIVAAFVVSLDSISRDAEQLRLSRDRSSEEGTKMWSEVQRLSGELEALHRTHGLAQEELSALRQTCEALRQDCDGIAAEAALQRPGATPRWRDRLGRLLRRAQRR